MKELSSHSLSTLQFLSFVVLLAWVLPGVSAARTKALIPLYVDLENNVKAWDPLFKAYVVRHSRYRVCVLIGYSIEGNPNTDFTIIVNPDDGPGRSTLPSSDKFTKQAEKLKSYRNVQLIGYVKIGYAGRNLNTVTSQIGKYAGWASANRKIAVDGIFLDEAPYNWNSTIERYLTDVKRSIKNNAGLGRKQISKFSQLNATGRVRDGANTLSSNQPGSPT
jgi:hypothetical protein